MGKMVYKYKLVKVPTEAIEHVDSILKKRKAENPETRKADVWMSILKVKK